LRPARASRPGPRAICCAQWLSPAFPLGAFAHSHGLEWAIAAGEVRDAAALRRWIEAVLIHGTGRNDAIIAAHALAGGDPGMLAETAEAMAPSRERLEEMRAQGGAFCRTLSALTGAEMPARPLAVALGVAARAYLALPAGTVVSQMLQAFAGNLVAAGVRFVPFGQTAGQVVLQALQPAILQTTRVALAAPLDALGGAFLRGDMAAMHHETQETRIFRT